MRYTPNPKFGRLLLRSAPVRTILRVKGRRVDAAFRTTAPDSGLPGGFASRTSVTDAVGWDGRAAVRVTAYPDEDSSSIAAEFGTNQTRASHALSRALNAAAD